METVIQDMEAGRTPDKHSYVEEQTFTDHVHIPAPRQGREVFRHDLIGFSLGEIPVQLGQQKQENQITAIRKFIQQQVDYIVLMPISESGWDSVLQEVRPSWAVEPKVP